MPFGVLSESASRLRVDLTISKRLATTKKVKKDAKRLSGLAQRMQGSLLDEMTAKMDHAEVDMMNGKLHDAGLTIGAQMSMLPSLALPTRTGGGIRGDEFAVDLTQEKNAKKGMEPHIPRNLRRPPESNYHLATYPSSPKHGPPNHRSPARTRCHPKTRRAVVASQMAHLSIHLLVVGMARRLTENRTALRRKFKSFEISTAVRWQSNRRSSIGHDRS